MVNDRIGKKIAGIYRERRFRSEDIAAETRENYLSRYPGLRKIEDRLSDENARLALLIISDGVARDTSESKDRILKERSEYLTTNGIPSNYDKPAYVCDKCSDTGFDKSGKNGRCSCYYDILVPMLFTGSGFPGINRYSFDKFSADLFPDKVDEAVYRSKNSPRKQILAIKDAAIKFTENFESDEQPSLFFIGSPGTGKTYLAGCITDSLIRRGVSVLYLSAPAMFDVISEYRTASGAFSPDRERLESASEAYAGILNCDLLIIDDLGTETFNSNRQPELLAVINHRTGCAKKMIITTNLEMSDLMNYYDERLISRIYGSFSVFRFFGDDLRLKIRSN